VVSDVHRPEELAVDSVQSSEQISSQQTSRLAVTCQQCAASTMEPDYIQMTYTNV